MAGAKRGLGRGLGALFGEDTVEEVIAEEKAEKAAIATQRARKNTLNHKPENDGAKTRKAEKTAKTGEKKLQEDDLDGQMSLNLEDTANVTSNALKAEEEAQTELELPVSEIEPNRDQPRKAFDEEQLEELADSIRKYGVLQPLLVQKKGDSYEIIAGERRWRAAKLAGLKKVPVVIREYSPQQTMEIALIENVQRADLNPIEEALAYQRLMQEFSLKQEEIAERVSKNRTTITNSMRLLNLVPEVQQMLAEGRITSGHARALLGVSDPQQQLALAQKVEQEKLSVREIEKAVKLLGREKKEKKEPRQEPKAQKLRFSYKEQREYASIEGEIAALEEKIADKDTEMAAHATDYTALQRLTEEKEVLEAQLEEKMERWMYLSDLAERIEAQKG